MQNLILSQNNQNNKFGTLYCIGTPIGNLEDITLRAIHILKSCDEIYCEDTRVTTKLLQHFQISKPTYRLDENTILSKREEVANKVINGLHIAFCTDAGMPCISDPGSKLVSYFLQNNLEYTIIPGPSACVTAFAGSGFNSKNFYFAGFLSKQKSERLKQLEELSKIKNPIIIYESPKRVIQTLKDINKINESAIVAIGRELTKIHEQYIVYSIKDLIEKINNNPDFLPLKGEFVICISDFYIPKNQDIVKLKCDIAVYIDTLLKAGLTKTQIKQNLIDCFDISRNDAFRLVTEQD